MHERLGGIQPRPLETGERNPLDQVGHQLERAAFREFYEQHDRLDRFMWMLPGVGVIDHLDSELHLANDLVAGQVLNRVLRWSVQLEDETA